MSQALSVEILRSRLSRRQRRGLDRPGRAAVLVAIVGPEAEPSLLLTRRTEDLPTHAGQVAFPGGLMQPGEIDLVRTALREAQEEIGLPPEEVEILGLLDDFDTRSGTVAVTPAVGRVERLPPLHPRPEEVARVFTIPIEGLLRRERWRSGPDERPGRTGCIWYFDHDGETLWGLSARIVLHLLEVAGADLA